MKIEEMRVFFYSDNETYFCLTLQSPPAVHYVSKHSKGQIAVVENEEQLQKFLQIKSDLPDLKGNLLSDSCLNCVFIYPIHS